MHAVTQLIDEPQIMNKMRSNDTCPNLHNHRDFPIFYDNLCQKKSGRRTSECHVRPRIRNETALDKAGSANRAGSGHGGSGESPDVRYSQESRTKNAPEDDNRPDARSVFCFQP